LSLFNELKQRNVFRVAIGYIVACWLMLQVADLVLENIGAPDWVMQALMLVLALGFPVMVIFSWAFEVTPEGIRRESEIAHDQSTRQITGRKVDRAIISVLVVTLGYFAFDKFFLSSHRPAASGMAATQTAPQPAAADELSPERESSVTGTRIAALDDRPAIAVLPFDNLSSDPEQAYFADGIAEDLITRLSSWRAFPVIARNSSFRYRGGNEDVQQVSQQLGARYIVEGSVRRSGDRIRVSAQLIDATSGEHVWADTYDAEVTDVFASQDEISTMIAASLVGDLNRAEAQHAQQRGTENLEAWSLYQLGLQHAGSFTRDDFGEARRLFTLAAERDPRFATAMAQLAFATLWEVVLGWNDNPVETIASTLELTRRAEYLDPRDPVAQAALGWAYLMAGDLNNGLDAAMRAVQLNPSMPEAWGWLSWAQLLAGNMEACIEAAERTQRLDPLGVVASVVFDNLSQAYWQEGRYEEGLLAAQRLLAELPDYFLGHVYLAMNAVELGLLDEARAAIDAGRLAQPDLSLELVQGGYGVERPAIDARRNAVLRQAGLE
jgi:TolB-like protein